MIDRAAGVMKAAATPVTKRARMRVQPSSARPPRPEKSRKTVSQPRSIRRRPRRSAARPPRRVAGVAEDVRGHDPGGGAGAEAEVGAEGGDGDGEHGDVDAFEEDRPGQDEEQTPGA